MKFDRIAGPDRFLIEDVILALANARGMLGWILAEKTSAAMQQAALDRLDRQIALLTERAAALQQGEAVGSDADETTDIGEGGRTVAPPEDCGGSRGPAAGGSIGDDWNLLGPRLARMLLDLHPESAEVAGRAVPVGSEGLTGDTGDTPTPALPLQDGFDPAPDAAPVFRSRRGTGEA